jgi:probable F420-dependent oxidoreductase
LRIGFALPQYGPYAQPQLIADLSTRLEDLGYDSLWVGDRLLWPLSPANAYPGTADGVLPRLYEACIDPLQALAVAAANTSRIRLGTSTLNAVWHSPVLLARTLASLDLLSAGRLDVGLGMSWSKDEYTALGLPWKGRAERFEEIIDVLEAMWTTDVVEHQGPIWTVPSSYAFPKPAQKPRPPLLLGGFNAIGVARAVRRADGWAGFGMPLPYLKSLWEVARRTADENNRDFASVRMSLRINATVTDKPADPELAHTTGTIAQISDYIRATGILGADEAFIDLQESQPSVAQMMEIAEAFIAELRD